jgi:RNA polymerase sigma-70 factor, ECF subfamily
MEKEGLCFFKNIWIKLPHNFVYTGEKLNKIKNPDFELIQKYQQGDEQAFTKLFYKYYPIVYSTLIGKGISQTDAEDSTADIFIKLADSLKSYQLEKPFQHYVRRVVRNKFFDILKTKHIQRYPLTAEILVSKDISGFETAEIEEIINLCLLKILNLTRRSIVLSWLEGYTRKQMAEILSLPIGTIHSHLERGKADFRKCVRGKLT